MRGDAQNRTAHTFGIEAALGQQFRTFAVLDEAVGQAKVEAGHRQARRGEALEHGAAGAALKGILLHGDEQFMRVSKLQHQIAVEWFDEAHVHHGRVQFFAHRQRRIQQRAEGQDGDAATGAPD